MHAHRVPPRPIHRAVALFTIAAAPLVLGACSDDDNEPSGPSVPGVDEGGGLAPAGTDQGTDVGEVDEEVDDNITGD